ncbi:hypothetical protein [Enemella evansiae]|uniref:hypothetical protein n=1 Tax=Enemella evansiae TaxID=2016499 RepID=UPI00105BA22D|nr:hypothetical protein [Enemella evansiae]TDO93465.1 hypothetical protein C8D81_1250 [Enemella evansiae]
MPGAPRLDPALPVLERGDGTLQIGVETERGALIATTGPGDWGAALRLLDGRRSCAQVAAETGIPDTALAVLVTRLERLGLLTHGPARPRRRRPRVRLLGAGALGRAVAEAYLAAEIGPLQVVDPDPPALDLYPELRPSAGETLIAQLRAAGLGPVGGGDHWHSDRQPDHDLTVVASDTLECDRALTDTLLRQDRPHLLLRPLPDGVLLGPLVVPGVTCCTRCTDLVRRRDPAWPHLLAQLCRARSRPSPELLGWAAQTAVLQLRSWWENGAAETLGATLEVRRGHWSVRQRCWPRHPDCGCGGWP